MTDIRLYISSVRDDVSFATRLAGDLQRAGLSVIRETDMEVSASLTEALSRAIDRADFVLAVLSPEYYNSPWALEAMNHALIHKKSPGINAVIPLIVKDCRIPLPVDNIQIVDFRDGYERGSSSLIGLLFKQDAHGRAAEKSAVESHEHAKAVEELRAELKEAVQSFKMARLQQVPEKRPSKASGADSPYCFTIMPFGDPNLKIVYEDFVKPVCTKCGILCERGDDAFGSNVIMDDILPKMHDADLVIAELTGKNPNVFYEIGMCHALGKAVLLIAQSIEDIPFDLRHRRVLLYEYSPRGCKQLEAALQQHIGAILNDLKKSFR